MALQNTLDRPKPDTVSTILKHQRNCKSWPVVRRRTPPARSCSAAEADRPPPVGRSCTCGTNRTSSCFPHIHFKAREPPHTHLKVHSPVTYILHGSTYVAHAATVRRGEPPRLTRASAPAKSATSTRATIFLARTFIAEIGICNHEGISKETMVPGVPPHPVRPRKYLPTPKTFTRRAFWLLAWLALALRIVHECGCSTWHGH